MPPLFLSYTTGCFTQMASLGKNQVWEEGHKFGFVHDEFEVFLRNERGHVK